ncbi:TonB-dependent receptor [Sphingobium sp.]|uniref:TonB-dependent receptor n=1 Tax=Sphingobium sp. TaxID=1912891 RepID=UPI0025E5F473|nr:TonB-dependent receptor [Sphingobium sp.]
MERRHTALKLWATTALAGGLFYPMALQAQVPQSDPRTLPAGQGDATSADIVVTGIRASLASAINQKRQADSIVDTIAAEDIGAFPDTNIAESLQRVTGIQIARNRGEGQSISIRGLEPKFARVLLNGDGVTSLSPSGINTVGTAGQSRTFDFTILAPDFISALEVYKSPTADLDEGGMAGTVNIKTIRPLDLKSRRLNVNIQGSKNSYADQLGYKATAIYADQFLDDTVGVMIGYDRSRRFLVTQSYQSSGMERKLESGYNPAGRVDFNFDGDTRDAFRLNHVLQLQNDRGTRDRETIIATLQARPVDGLTLRLDGLRSTFNSDLSGDFESAQFHLNGDPSIPGNPVRATHFSSIVPTSDDVSNDPAATPIAGLIDYIDRDGVFLSNTNKLAAERSRLQTFTASADYESGPWLVSLQGTRSTSRKFSSNYGIDAQRWGNVIQDYRTDVGGIPTFAYVRGTDPLDASKWYIPNAAFVGTAVDTPVKAKQRILSGDVKYEPSAEWLTAIRFGVKWARNSLFQGDRRVAALAPQLAALIGTRAIPNAFNGGAGILAAPYLKTFGGDDFLSRYDGDSTFPTTYLAPDTRAFIDRYGLDAILSLPGAVTTNLSSTYRIREETLAGYVRADYSLFDGALTGNVGVRAVRTKQVSSGFSFDPTTLTLAGTNLQASGGLPIGAERSYTDWLPSFNAKYALDDNKVARFSVSRTLTRPDFGQIAPAVSTPSFVARTQSASNPALDPYRAWNADLSLEWYPSSEALVSMALFYKKIEGYLVNSSSSVSYAVRDTGTGQILNLDFQRTFPVNGSSTSVKGVEIAYQQPLTMLPAPFDGLGFNANYTFTDAGKIQFTQGGNAYPLTSVSKHSFNLVGYYEKGPVSTRIAYNYRSKYVEDALSSRLDGVYVKPIGQLDASFRLTLNKAVALTVDATNITDEPIERVNKYGFGRGYEVNGRTFMFGVRYSLN